MKNKKTKTLLLAVLGLSIIAINGCQSIKTFTKKPEQYQGADNFNWKVPVFDASRKNVFIVANTKLTELFDMIAPYYLFNATEKANVFIVAEKKSPIYILDKLYVLPQFTLSEVDSLKLHADVIVIPFLGVIDTNQNPLIVNWIKNHYTDSTKILSICDGAATAAATGLYDGKPLTCHASDYEMLTPHFNKPIWVQNVSVTKSGNLYSTGGVSNAVEGSLTVINDLFGKETTQNVMTDIHYRYPEIKMEHQSIVLGTKGIFTILKKVSLRKNRNVGVLLQDNSNELQLASILDTYKRTLPATLKAITLNGRTVQTKYGLTLVSTEEKNTYKLHELHVLITSSVSKADLSIFKNTEVIKYDGINAYPIDVCIDRITTQYGNKFAKVSERMLDYN